MPSPTLKKIVKDGVAYYSVGDAAKYLGTTATKIRELLGSGDLEMAQLRVNGKILVTAKSLSDRKIKIGKP